jgi:disulfide bond formation protein DsbB
MASLLARLGESRTAAAVILFGALATIAGALVFEHVFGILPCPLCLRQRIPYYAALPIALAATLVPDPRWTRIGLGLLAAAFVISAGLGIHHAGVEWGWWAGPSDCAGTPAAAPDGMADFLKQLQTTRVISCTEAAWRFLGLSLAGWNVLISLGLAGVAGAGLVGGRVHRGLDDPRPYGSSSVSQ